MDALTKTTKKTIPSRVRPNVDVQNPFWMRMRKLSPSGWKFYCLLTANVWKAPLWHAIAAELDDVLVCGRGREMKIELVNHQVDRNLVVHIDGYSPARGGHFHIIFRRGNLQIFNRLPDRVANLFRAVSIYARKARCLLHLVRQFILGDVRRHHLHRRIHHKSQNRGDQDGLELSLAPFTRSSPPQLCLPVHKNVSTFEASTAKNACRERRRTVFRRCY